MVIKNPKNAHTKLKISSTNSNSRKKSKIKNPTIQTKEIRARTYCFLFVSSNVI